jgi:hypothetical protein
MGAYKDLAGRIGPTGAGRLRAEVESLDQQILSYSIPPMGSMTEWEYRQRVPSEWVFADLATRREHLAALLAWSSPPTRRSRPGPRWRPGAASGP